MERIICSLFAIIITVPVMAASSRITTTRGDAATAYNYNYMYPYMDTSMRTALNPGTIQSVASNPISAVARVTNTDTRRVVSRPTAARAAAGTVASSTATQSARAATSTGASARRVVPRATSTVQAARTVRTDDNTVDSNRTGIANVESFITTSDVVSSARCLADYTECMNTYCVRENTAYNRCYCSAKLAQIDARYQPAIDELVKQIIVLKNAGTYTDAEMNEYWMDTIGKYTGTNSWQNIDDALDIDWSTMESRTRGQNAFATGHEYCSQHLRGCAYAASNMRDAYRAEIARDCAEYESSLQKLQNAAESIVGSYQ